MTEDSGKKKTRKGYQKTYYLENREKILAKKRRRYARDKAYRESIKNSVKRRREAQASKTEKNEITFAQAKANATEEVFVIDGSPIFGIGSGAADVYLGCWSGFLYASEQRGVLPPTPLTTSRGSKTYRYYSMPMLSALKEELDKRGGKASKGDTDLYISVEKAWRELGLPREGRPLWLLKNMLRLNVSYDVIQALKDGHDLLSRPEVKRMLRMEDTDIDKLIQLDMLKVGGEASDRITAQSIVDLIEEAFER